MSPEQLQATIEAILMTAKGPVNEQTLSEVLKDDEVELEAISKCIETIAKECDGPCRGVRVEKVAGGWRMVTPAQLAPHLNTFHGLASRQRLSQAALEVLSIVAHRQPVTLPEINFLRGANSSGVIRTLLERKLVRTSGRKKVVGKPFLYRTTNEFLIHFGLDSIKDLPDPESLLRSETDS